MIKGFIDIFRAEFRSINFPIEVNDIRLARDPLRTVALGCLEYSLNETRARGGEASPTNTVERASVSKTVAKAGKSKSVPVEEAPPARPMSPAAHPVAAPKGDTDVFEPAAFGVDEEDDGADEVAPEDMMDDAEEAIDPEEKSGPPLIS